MKHLNTKLLILFVAICHVATYGQQVGFYPPVEYVENQGQWDGPFLFKGNTNRGDIFLRKDGFRIFLSAEENHDKIHGLRHGWVKGPQTLKYHTFDILFNGANPNPDMQGAKPQKQYYNYYLGADQKRWKSGIHPVMTVDYKELYPNIDAHVYSEQGNIKYDMILHPGANLQDIQLEYTGLDGISLKDGHLILKTSFGEIKESIPYSYQFIEGEKKEVKCNFKLVDNKVQFEVGKGYNKEYDLYIDPVLVFCTFTGSTADNWGYTATYDSVGNFYAGGIVGYPANGSFIGNYPTTVGAFQTTFGGGGPSGMGNLFRYDASISKFNAVGNALLFSTYLGGLDNDQPHSLVVDNNDNLVVAGRTYSTNFPTTPGCFDASHNGNADIFVCKFNAGGTSLLGSTFIGGSADDCVNISADENVITPLDLKHNYGDDARSEVIVDNNNNIYVTASTSSNDFPTASPYQGSFGGGQDAVVIELNPTCSNLLWSTFLGGSANDAGYVISFNKTNQSQLYVAGGTLSSNFPTTAGTLHSTYQGGIADGFLLKFNANTKALLAGTYIGTNLYDQVYGVQTDDSDYVYIMGQTTGAYPIVGTSVYTNANSSQFLSKLTNNLSSIQYSTTFGTGSLAPGGTQQTDISPNAFLVDKCQNVYVSGWGGPIIGGNPGTTNGLPVTAGAIKSTTDGSDFYFIVLTKNFGNLLYGSFFGQTGLSGEHVDGGTSRFDKNGVIYQAICAACGASQSFPTTPNSYATQNGSNNCNLAALKIDFQLQNPDAQAVLAGPDTSCIHTVQFVNNSTSSTNYLWDFGDGSPLDPTSAPSHTYAAAGTYTVSLIAANPNGCTSTADTSYLLVVILDDTIHAEFTYKITDSCDDFKAIFTNTSTPNTGNPNAATTYIWDFGNGSAPFIGKDPGEIGFPTPTTYTVTLMMIDLTSCNDTSIYTQVIDFSNSLVNAAFDMPDTVCMPAIVNFIDQSTNASAWSWDFGDSQTSNQTNPTNTYLAPGTYTVTFIASNPVTCNLHDTLSKVITVFSSPVADFTWSPNPPEPNRPNSFKNLSTGATKYLWDFGDGTTSTQKDEVHVYEKSGTYNVCLTTTNQYGCRDTACKSVRGEVIPLVDVPTGFSPNGDGFNDVVYVKGYGISKMTFRIFNRWGEKIFESTDKSKGWDGRYKGVIQEMEVYQYTLSVTFFDGTKDFKKGNITLLK